MPILNNPQYEIFCQRIAAGSSKKQAARDAGYTENACSVRASVLLRRPEIKSRIAELTNRVVSHAVAEGALSKSWVLTELTELYQIAKVKQQVSAGTRCLELVGKELGMFQDVIPRELFTLMMSLMGASVARHVQDATALERVMADWERINVAEPKQLRAGMVEQDRGQDPSIGSTDPNVA